MSRPDIKLQCEAGADIVKDLQVLATAGTNTGITFAEGDEIKFAVMEDTPFSKKDFNGTPVYRIGCEVNQIAKWVPLGSFRKRPLNYGEWIVQPQLKLNKEFCEAGNDLELARLLCKLGTIKVVARETVKIAKEFVEDPVTKRKSIKKDEKGEYLTRDAKFPVWGLGE